MKDTNLTISLLDISVKIEMCLIIKVFYSPKYYFILLLKPIDKLSTLRMVRRFYLLASLNLVRFFTIIRSRELLEMSSCWEGCRDNVRFIRWRLPPPLWYYGPPYILLISMRSGTHYCFSKSFIIFVKCLNNKNAFSFAYCSELINCNCRNWHLWKNPNLVLSIGNSKTYFCIPVKE